METDAFGLWLDREYVYAMAQKEGETQPVQDDTIEESAETDEEEFDELDDEDEDDGEHHECDEEVD